IQLGGDGGQDIVVGGAAFEGRDENNNIICLHIPAEDEEVVPVLKRLKGYRRVQLHLLQLGGGSLLGLQGTVHQDRHTQLSRQHHDLLQPEVEARFQLGIGGNHHEQALMQCQRPAEMGDQGHLAGHLDNALQLLADELVHESAVGRPPQDDEVGNDLLGSTGDPLRHILIDGGEDVHLGLGGGSLLYEVLELALGTGDVDLGLLVVRNYGDYGHGALGGLVLDQDGKLQQLVEVDDVGDGQQDAFIFKGFGIPDLLLVDCIRFLHQLLGSAFGGQGGDDGGHQDQDDGAVKDVVVNDPRIISYNDHSQGGCGVAGTESEDHLSLGRGVFEYQLSERGGDPFS